MTHYEVRRRRGSYAVAIPGAPERFDTAAQAQDWAAANWHALGMQLGLEAFDIVEVTRLGSVTEPG